MEAQINRGGRGRKSECPQYIREGILKDSLQKTKDAEASGKLKDRLWQAFERRASAWGVTAAMAAEICNRGHDPEFAAWLERRVA